MASAERLEKDELEAWRSFLLMSQLMQRLIDRQLRRDSGMPHAYYVALVTLAQEKDSGGVLLTELADALGYSQSRMSQAIRKMEDSEWIVRRPDPLDRRAVRLTLSEMGRTALARATSKHLALVKETLIDPLSPEQVQQLIEIGDAVLPELVQRVVAPGALAGLRSYVATDRGGRNS
ncbi:MAG TPA: MarR family transcriptional regulator [Galbitalea sp.]|jgi:DNA-binding MarR family transcriptional regulator|nr:MarR family transcriptional regulator [Galbitalea sp.]